MSFVKNFSLSYTVLDANKDSVSEGDTVVGIVSLSLKRGTKVRSLFVKATGDASVHWVNKRRFYSAQRRYFKAKIYLIGENTKDSLLSEGTHHFRFELKIPQSNMPSSFEGTHGSIVYTLTAKMERSWWFPYTVQQEFCFVSKSILDMYQQCPQVCALEKKTGIFSKGQVQLVVSVDRKVYTPGETMSAVAKVANSSSTELRPVFSLEQQIVYRALGSTVTCRRTVSEMVGDAIVPQKNKIISCQVKIPQELNQTIHNCDILSVHYCLKAYLDSDFAFNPQVDIPIVIAHADVSSRLGTSSGTPCPRPAPHATLSTHTYRCHGASYSSVPSTSCGLCPQLPVPPADAQEQPPSYDSLFPDVETT